MAKQSLLVCDSCGAKRGILTMEGVRDDSMNVHMELCGECWSRLVREFRAVITNRRQRSTFRVIDEDLIQ